MAKMLARGLPGSLDTIEVTVKGMIEKVKEEVTSIIEANKIELEEKVKEAEEKAAAAEAEAAEAEEAAEPVAVAEAEEAAEPVAEAEPPNKRLRCNIVESSQTDDIE